MSNIQPGSIGQVVPPGYAYGTAAYPATGLQQGFGSPLGVDSLKTGDAVSSLQDYQSLAPGQDPETPSALYSDAGTAADADADAGDASDADDGDADDGGASPGV